MCSARLSRRILAAVLASVLCFQVIASLTARAAVDYTAKEHLGSEDFFRYNGIVFDYFESAQADIEGALAVWGESKIGTSGQYDVGASAHHVVMGPNHSDGYPTLVLGGEFTLGKQNAWNAINVYGGDVVLRDGLQDHYQKSPVKFGIISSPKYASSSAIDDFFQDAFDTIVHNQNAINNAYSDDRADIMLSDFNGWGNTKYKQTFRDLERFKPDNFKYKGNTEKVLVINILDKTGITINEPYITGEFEEYKWIVFNFPNVTDAKFTGASVLVDGKQINTSAPVSNKKENDILKHYASTLVWSFPAAESISVAQCGVVGSVIAPHATVEGNGGSINGLLVADSFLTKGGMELHSFRMNKPNFDEYDDSKGEGRVVLYKYDSAKTTSEEDYTLLSGAEFKLYKASGEYLDTYLVGADGRLRAGPLEEGSYYFIETEPPDGYKASSNPIPFAISAHSTLDKPIYLYVPNDPLTADITIKKTSSADGTIRPDGVFELYLAQGRMMPQLIGRKTIGSSGTITYEDLAEGRYYLVEVEAPEDYERLNGYIEITVDFSSVPNVTYDYSNITNLPSVLPSLSGNTLTVPNDPTVPPLVPPTEDRFDVLISKTVEGDSSRPIEGAVFELWVEGPSGWVKYTGYPTYPAPLTTDFFGHVYLELEKGNYELREITPPPGYQLNENPVRSFTVPDPGPSASPFRIERVSGQADYVAPDQEASDIDGLPVIIVDSPSLQEGTDSKVIHPQESLTEPPAGNPPFTASPEGVSPEGMSANAMGDLHTSDNLSSSPLELRFKTPAVSSSILSTHAVPMDVDARDTDVPVVIIEPDVAPSPPDLEGSVVVPVTPSPSRQRDGEVTVQPEESPAQRAAGGVDASGQRDGDVPITIQPQGHPPAFAPTAYAATPTQIVEIQNKPIGRIRVDKRDIMERDREVEGAVFGLYYNTGAGSNTYTVENRWEQVATGKTNAEGYVTFENLPPGEYRVMELIAPPDYEPITAPELVPRTDANEGDNDYRKYVVEIGKDDTEFAYSFIAHNPRTVGSFGIQKVDGDTQLPLPGATFDLMAWNEKEHRWEEHSKGHISNSEGLLLIPDLPYGRYKIVEMRPPDGYQLETLYDQNEVIFTIKSPGYYMGGVIPVENFRPPTYPEVELPSVDPPTGVSPPGGGGGSSSGGGRARDRDTTRLSTTEAYPDSSADPPPKDDPTTNITGDLPTSDFVADNPNTGFFRSIPRIAVALSVGLMGVAVVLYHQKHRD